VKKPIHQNQFSSRLAVVCRGYCIRRGDSVWETVSALLSGILLSLHSHSHCRFTVHLVNVNTARRRGVVPVGDCRCRCHLLQPPSITPSHLSTLTHLAHTFTSTRDSLSPFITHSPTHSLTQNTTRGTKARLPASPPQLQRCIRTAATQSTRGLLYCTSFVP
jgi:hypothetical protein